MNRGTGLKPGKPLNQVSAKQRAKREADGEQFFTSTFRPKPGNELKATKTAGRELKRTPLKSRPTPNGPDKETADAVVDREQHSCVVCGKWLEPDGRGSSWSIHHRRRIRTDNRMCNLVAVCGGADVPGCHQEIHANVAKAELAGWLVKKAFDPADKVMAHSQFGWVLLTPMGNVIQAVKEESREHPF